MKVIHDPAALGPFDGGLFVPTMGALHEGHFELVRRASEHPASAIGNAPVVVSIFVNPTQFNDPADLERYPRTLEQDAAGCERAGADVVFAPSVETVYPRNAPVAVPELPKVATAPRLEDAHRPAHFAGVCQVVRRLFDLVRPSAAFFGEKDWQQLQVIAAMTREQGMPITIIPVPTVREPDGLAMSSRNRFLTPEERHAAAAIFAALRAGQSEPNLAAASSVMNEVLAHAGLTVEYAVVREERTLLPVTEVRSDAALRALIAARVGAVRLIDNASWPG